MPEGMIGRERELEAAAGFLSELKDGPAVLVFAGEPGIGKTTVWRDAVSRARALSFVVLSAQPVEAEAGLAFAGLADLLEPVAEEVLPQLPEPQRRAVEVALLRADPGSGRVDQRAVSAGTGAVLRSLRRRGPVVVAVDLQWLDRPSARVLAFALRRQADMPVGVLASERVEHGIRLPLALERAVPEERFSRVELGPLSLAALHQLLRERLGRSFTRRMVARIEQATGGNPFFALELARSLPEEAPAGVAALPMPDRLLELVEARILGLPRRARRALLAAAGLSAPTVETVWAATGGTAAESRRALEHAESRGIIEAAGSRLRFTHPLFAAAAYATAPAVERRRMHRQLAGLTEEIEERARHLALGADSADAGLAALLDAAAEHARARGAPESGAELAEWARALTPAERILEIQRRTVQAADYHFHAGELRRAREMLEAVLQQPSGGLERADALRLLGEIHYHEDSFDEAIRVLQQALEYVGDNRELRLTIELSLAFASVSAADFAGTSEHAAGALAVAQRGAEPASVAEALAAGAIADFLLGRGLDEAKIERALRLEDPYHQVPSLLRPSLIAGYLALFEGRLEHCDRLLLPLRKRIFERGEDSDLVGACAYLIWSASWRGDLTGAETYAVEAIDSAARIDSDSLRCMALAYAAVASAYAGETTLTKSRAEEAIALASRTGYGIGILWASWALGLLALSQGDFQAADAAMGRLAAMFEDHVPEPVRAFFLPDEIEALIGLGRLDRAERLLAAFEEAARRLDRPWALMLAARCRALLLAARGDLEGASAQLGQALSRCAELELRVEVARTFLVAGQVERRRRRKAIAADHLRRAVGLFEHMGAAMWAERARAELGRVGLRPPAPTELTASERRVAELITSGRTNREVAAQLFMSPKTVETKLACVYRKLGVHSRAQLGARLANPESSLPEQT
jgi:DNA-binding CsgD family transcriptional regulator/DNA polymerase III delta prime subunit